MPCYLTGTIKITDEELLKQEASKFGFVLDKDRLQDLVAIYKEGKLTTKEIFRQYNIATIKLASQKKGWKVSSIKQQEDKIIIRVRE